MSAALFLGVLFSGAGLVLFVFWRDRYSELRREYNYEVNPGRALIHGILARRGEKNRRLKIEYGLIGSAIILVTMISAFAVFIALAFV